MTDYRALLEVQELVRRFGGVSAVDSVSFGVAEGELRGLIGPNGAGKSTLFHLISGHLHPDSGTLSFRGKRIERKPPAARARLGIAITFQTVHLFNGMTVLENTMVGGHAWTMHEWIEASFRLPRHHREERLIKEQAAWALERVGLDRFMHQPAESLPLGRQRSLQIARAICSKPELLLLDEPATGLRAEERRDLFALLGKLHTEGLTMILVEHDVGFVTSIAERITVLDRGHVIAEGTPEEIQYDPLVITAYLGTATSDESAGIR
ncbi:MAG: ABC transporter ATP-binding protein [Actinobacteria bacterium]|nr:ABC transporter ATP-binding protein [Actinomycetota bacterium]MCL5447006.1 ABC transporter ATP-binding protein [Actinomycetota bacterium]